MTTRTKRLSLTGLLHPLVTCCLAQDPVFPAAPVTTIQGGGEFGELFVNGGVNTIVAGELAKAAFQHGFEEYGVDILRRLRLLVQKHKPPEGVEGIPERGGVSVRVNGALTQAALETVRNSRYAVPETADGAQVETRY